MNNRASRHAIACALIAGIAVSTNTVLHAQAAGTAPELHEPAIDEFGLERKSGRVFTPTPKQIDVGGSGAQNISIAYMPLNPGRPGSQDYADMGQLDMRQVGHVFIYHSTNVWQSPYYWEYYTIQYPNGSETFRRNLTQGTPFQAEYSDGATLVTTGGGVLFTDRNGITLQTNADANNSTILTYPDGRQVYYNGYQATIANNFGFILKSQTASDGNRMVAANQAVDICTIASTSCSGLSKDRHSLITSAGANNNWTFFDAGGGRTIYRSTPIQANTEKYYCWYDGQLRYCNSPFLVTRYYPAGITFPKDSAESVTISYVNPDSQEEVEVSSITKDGTTITYNPVRVLYGSYGSSPNPNTLPYHLQITSSLGGNQIAYSQATRGFAGWGNGRMTLDYVTDGLNRTSYFSSNPLDEVSGVTLPEGNGQTLSYDSRWNVQYVYDTPKTNSGVAQLVTQYIYWPDCTNTPQSYCNKPSAIIDRRNNRTDFTYNPQGQILTLTGPADSSGLRPITTYGYTFRTAYIKDANGNTVAAGTPISMLTQKIVCRSQQNCVGTADAVVTTYDYGPTTGLNNLLLRGVAVTADGQTRRTCYGYNYFGEKISETRPMAGLASCP
jgi:hypothetical protein